VHENKILFGKLRITINNGGDSDGLVGSAVAEGGEILCVLFTVCC
jgi:hypothetical protein